MNKIKENLVKDWKFFAILSLVIAIFLLISFYTLDVSNKLYNATEKVETSDYIENVKTGTLVEQKIIAKSNNLKRINIEFESFKDRYDIGGTVTIGIKDANGDTISTKTITRNYIREYSDYKFEFKRQKDSEGKEYILYFEFDNQEEGKDFFSIKKINDGNIDGMTINGELQDGRIAIQECYLSTSKQILFILMAVLLSVYAFFICTFIYYKKDIRAEKIFLYTVPVICIFYMISMPTFKNHDEIYHWYRGYEVSIGKFMSGIDGDILGTNMPESIRTVTTQDWQQIDYGTLRENIHMKLAPEEKSIIYSDTAAIYSFLQYLPQGVGIFIGRIFTDRVLLLTYAGRIMNMIVALTCMYFAIKKIPFGKKALLLLSFIPITIEGFTSLSPDAMTISVACLYVAYIFNLAFSSKDHFIGTKQKIIMTVLSVIMALCKIVYIPLVLLMFVIPKEKFKNEKKLKNIIIIALIAFIINIGWLSVSSIYLSHFREGDSSVQIKEAILNPIRYIQNCFYTLNINGANYIMTMFGQQLGWGEMINLYSIVPYTLLILAIWISISDSSLKEKFKLYQKVIIALTVFAIILLIFTSLYVQWTLCGSNSILGIQGRYFIPILPLIIMLIGCNIKVKTEYSDETISKSITIVGVLLQIIAVLSIVIGHL